MKTPLRYLLTRAVGAAFVVIVLGLSGTGAAASSSGTSAEDAQASTILGNWLTQKHDGIVRIIRTRDGLFEGRIVGGDDPSRTDELNPDPSLRQRPVVGVVILQDMQYDGSGHWSGGSIYDPDTGHTYRCRLQLRGTDGLRVHGFLGVAVLGRTQLWTRYRGTSLQLPPHTPH